MALRRALVSAPLAVLVAVAAHVMAFGADHALGGPHAGELLAVGFGGSLLLAVVAIFWLGLTETDARAGERSLAALLPARGVAAAASILAISGFAAFAGGELLEGRSPFGTLTAWLALCLGAILVTLAARYVLRWLAESGAALAAFLTSTAERVSGVPAPAVLLEDDLATIAGRFQTARRGRAPPHS